MQFPLDSISSPGLVFDRAQPFPDAGYLATVPIVSGLGNYFVSVVK
jgi:hypothetical protein